MRCIVPQAREFNNIELKNFIHPFQIKQLTQIFERGNIVANFGVLQAARFNEEAHYGDVSNRNCRR